MLRQPNPFDGEALGVGAGVAGPSEALPAPNETPAAAATKHKMNTARAAADNGMRGLYASPARTLRRADVAVNLTFICGA
jgi:hypothetical protein